MKRIDHEKDGPDNTSNFMEGLSPSITDALENIEGEHEVYEEKSAKQLASLCMKYLQKEKEVPKRDLKMSIYLKFLDDPNENVIREILKKNEELTEKDLWEMSRAFLDHIHDNTDVITIEKNDYDHKYIWKE